MAQKRSALKQLTQDNYDDPDVEPERDEPSTAAPDVLASRVIRTAKRRNRADPSDEKRGIFSGFSGFAKAPAAPAAAFGFLSSVANGSSGNGEASKTKPFSFLDKITASAGKTEESDKPKPFSFLDKIPAPSDKKEESDKNKPFSFFDGNKNKSTEPAKDKPLSFLSNPGEKDSKKPNAGSESTAKGGESTSSIENSEYYINLKSLNLSVSEWIKSHVDKNPYCILTPVFDDYIKHLKELEKLRPNGKAEDKSSEKKINNSKNSDTKSPEPSSTAAAPSFFAGKSTSPKADTAATPSLISGTPKNDAKADAKNATTSLPSSPFGSLFSNQFTSTPFGGGEKPAASTKFAFGGTTPFSFGSGSIVADNKPAEGQQGDGDQEEESDEPPKVTFTPVVEEDSVYTKRCKVFVKKADAFADRGVGTLFVKPIKDSSKYQLVVRADTSLGNLLLNLVLTEAIPTQRTGKNNVMLVCVPNADAKPPPVPALVRVKSPEEADELLEVLDKYKR